MRLFFFFKCLLWKINKIGREGQTKAYTPQLPTYDSPKAPSLSLAAQKAKE